MIYLDDRVPIRIYQLFLLVCECSPEHKDDALLCLTADDLDDRIGEPIITVNEM